MHEWKMNESFWLQKQIGFERFIIRPFDSVL